MKRKYLRSPVTGKVVSRKGQVYTFRIKGASLQWLALRAAAGHPVLEWAIEESGGVFSTVRFVVTI